MSKETERLAATLMIEDLQDDSYSVKTIETILKVKENQELISALDKAHRYLSDYKPHDQNQVDSLVRLILKAV